MVSSSLEGSRKNSSTSCSDLYTIYITIIAIDNWKTKLLWLYIYEKLADKTFFIQNCLLLIRLNYVQENLGSAMLLTMFMMDKFTQVEYL